MIIAIDGPAASGKGTLARRIADLWGLPCLDTGLLYRAVARDAGVGEHHVDAAAARHRARHRRVHRGLVRPVAREAGVSQAAGSALRATAGASR